MRVINQEMTTVHVDDIRQHPRNPNNGNVSTIAQSIAANGFYGAVVVQRSTGYILAGNHRWLAARSEGAQTIPVIYVDVDERQAVKILLADNRTAEMADRDAEVLAELLAELKHDDDLAGTGYVEGDLSKLLEALESNLPKDQAARSLDPGFQKAVDYAVSQQSDAQTKPSAQSTGAQDSDEADSPYVSKINIPIYEPKGNMPQLRELTDKTKTSSLMLQIDEAEQKGLVDRDLAGFLRDSAQRHTKFHYARIAEYYCHATKEVQELMENSALVIVDLDRALENGFIKLTQKMQHLAKVEQGVQGEG